MKTKINILAVMITFMTMNLIAATKGEAIVTEKRVSNAYHFISIAGEMNVTLVQDKNPGIVVEGTSKQIENTITMLRNDTLFIYSTQTASSTKRVSLSVHIDELVALHITGKTRVDSKGYITSDIFSIKAEGGAEINIDVRALKVDSKATGSSQIKLSGSTGQFSENAMDHSIIDSVELHHFPQPARNKGVCFIC